MQLTEEMRRAISVIEKTNNNLFITGKAGTGKTTLLRYIVDNVGKQFVVVAPTGIAAINAKGTTIHSMFFMPFGVIPPDKPNDKRLPKWKANVLKKVDAIIIDEVSMVKPDTMDFIDKKLREARKSKKPFGGVQIIMFGDLYQLPPVITPEEQKIIDIYYEGQYFFNAKVMRESGFQVVELTQVFRQNDPKFIDFLNRVRNYQITEEDLEMLEDLRNKQAANNFDSKTIHICTHRSVAKKINTTMLGSVERTYFAEVKDNFPDSAAPCEKDLELRVGARVMTLTNDKEKRYYNGSLGVVTAMSDSSITVMLDDGIEVELEKNTWKSIDYQIKKKDGKEVIEEVVKGTLTQFPLTLAWAITIHKSQGLTFNNIAIHAAGVFCPGQIYVALSRCTSLEGIYTDCFIGRKHIIPDEHLLAFEKAYKTTDYYFNVDTYNLMRSFLK